MPCPEKFKESLELFQVSESVKTKINEGYEKLVTGSPKAKRAAYFKRALDVMNEELPQAEVKKIFEYNACCKSGARLKSSKEFARINVALPLAEKLNKIARAPYLNMGKPYLDEENNLVINAVSYVYEGKFACGCGTFSRLKRDYPVAKEYCYCCGGHFKFHYEIMLNLSLELIEVVSSPLNSDGQNPCVLKYRILS